jgi:hypothetical protein
MRIIASLIALLLCGCASQASWRRADGMPSTPDAAKIAEARCRGEFQMDYTFRLVTAREIEPCMARYGWLLISNAGVK